jgi:hypothetical protein
MRAGPGRRTPTRVGCALFRQRRFSVDRRHAAGRRRRTHSGRGVPLTAGGSPFHRSSCQRAGRAQRLPTGAGARCSLIARGDTPSTGGQRAALLTRLSSGRGHVAPCSPEVSFCRLPAAGPRGCFDCRPGGGRCTPIAGVVISPSDGRWAARFTRLPTGRGPTHPVRRRRLLTDCRPAGRTVPATATRAGVAAPDRRSRLRTARRPVGRSGFRVCQPASGILTPWIKYVYTCISCVYTLYTYAI